MNKLRLLELFGGIGACSKALERLGIDYEIADYVEIDKYAVKSYNSIHNTNFEPQDICEWDKDIKVDLIMHGSPCQDFSLAGKQAGGDKDSGTRSSLMYETIRIVDKLKPKYVIWENVKNLLSKKHRHNFDAYLETMEQLGYKNYYQVLNAKDYGIPQNRERVFTVSILSNENFEFPKGVENTNKIIEHNPKGKHQQDFIQDEDGLCRCIPAGTHGSTPHLLKTLVRNYEFPPKQELKLKLKDILEDEVDEKYYLSEKIINKIKVSSFSQEKKRIQEKDYCDTLLARDYKDPKCVDVTRKYGVFDTEKSKHQAGSVYDKNGLSPTLDTMQGGYRQPCIEIKSKCKRLHQLVEKTDFEEGKVLNMDLYNQTTNENISQCLTEPHHNSQRLFDGYRIRKLTPKECWRLMGFDDDDFEKAAKVNSNTQLYKQAGNSIVVNVLEEILKNLLLKQYDYENYLCEENDKLQQENKQLKEDIHNIINIINKNCDDLEATEEEFDSLDRWCK